MRAFVAERVYCLAYSTILAAVVTEARRPPESGKFVTRENPREPSPTTGDRDFHRATSLVTTAPTTVTPAPSRLEAGPTTVPGGAVLPAPDAAHGEPATTRSLESRVTPDTASRRTAELDSPAPELTAAESGGGAGASASALARPTGPSPAWRRVLSRGWPLILLALSKAKFLVILLKFPAFGTFATMLVSLAVYAVAFGLPFAIGFIAQLFIHEMGHAIVLKRQGVKATAPLFIPFVGAVIGMRELPKNVYAEAQMALGGPILGSLGALLLLMLWQATNSPLLLALAYVGFWLNLFNLIPLSPLDGGRAMAAISPLGWALGLGLMLILFLKIHSLFLGLILIMGAIEVFQRWRSRQAMVDYYTIAARQRLTIGIVYFGLAALLAVGAAALQPHLLTHRPGG